MKRIIVIYLLSIVLCPMSLFAQKDTVIVVESEARVIEQDTTLTVVPTVVPLKAESQKPIAKSQEQKADTVAKDTTEGFRFTTIEISMD